MRATFVMLSEAKHLTPDRRLSIAANEVSQSVARSFANARDDKTMLPGPSLPTPAA
jgi:hypothetical protein